MALHIPAREVTVRNGGQWWVVGGGGRGGDGWRAVGVLGVGSG